jgi:hypothetical protein
MDIDDLMNNRFVQGLGVGALFYLLFQILAISLNSILRILETFAQWYRFHAMPHALIISAVLGFGYILLNGVFNSRSSN